MLRGSYTAKMDDKGRLKIPAGFKRVLDEQYQSQDFFVTSLHGECAWIYPLCEWEAIEQRLALLPSLNPTRRKYLDRTNYYGQVQQCDPQGRILIHQPLRGAAELLDEVTVLGHLTYLEVWSIDRFRARLTAQPFTLEDETTLSNLGI
ncbi:MAG TPA: division/cell wall cluster transcriptional repressor MraZ [Blastocatellia bacterium]|nr:division/cell wall cluster transcriptional repressor MraZ [Blastocatellia bacterium]